MSGIKIGFDACGRDVPWDFRRRLAEHNRDYLNDLFPLKLVWNPRSVVLQHPGWYHTPTRTDRVFQEGKYDQRWEIWIRRDVSRHPGAQRRIEYEPERLRMFEDGCIWMRLCPFEWKDGSYADPFSDLFLRAARKANAFRSTRFSDVRYGLMHELYGTESQVEDAMARRLHARVIDAGAGAYDHYRRYPNPIVAPYGKGGRADWRWRLK